ncbi:hypothetical protein U1Q18_012741 [Sarracenia purpurea var. burkii]
MLYSSEQTLVAFVGGLQCDSSEQNRDAFLTLRLSKHWLPSLVNCDVILLSRIVMRFSPQSVASHHNRRWAAVEGFGNRRRRCFHSAESVHSPTEIAEGGKPAGPTKNKQRQRIRQSCKSAQARRPAASASAGGDFSPELFF